MNRYFIVLAGAAVLTASVLAGCSSAQTQGADHIAAQPSIAETATTDIPNETTAQEQTASSQETAQQMLADQEEGLPTPDAADPAIKETEATKPTQSDVEAEKPSASMEQTHPTERPDEVAPIVPSEETQTKPADSKTEPVLITYEEFLQMDAYQQQAYYETFPDMQSYLEWFHSAVEEYEKEHPPINAGDGEIDLEEIIGGE